MSRWRIRVVAGMLAVACFVLSSSAISAKGLPTEVTISGPGLPTALRITDPFVTAPLGTTSFMQFDQRFINPPAVGGSFYEIERDGFDHVRYYPGGSMNDSYVYYEGLFNGSSGYDDHWYPVSAVGDMTIRMLLVASGVQDGDVARGMGPVADGTLDRARAVIFDAPAPGLSSSRQPSASVPVGAWLALVGVAGLFVGCGLGSLVRTRGLFGL